MTNFIEFKDAPIEVQREIKLEHVEALIELIEQGMSEQIPRKVVIAANDIWGLEASAEGNQVLSAKVEMGRLWLIGQGLSTEIW